MLRWIHCGVYLKPREIYPDGSGGAIHPVTIASSVSTGALENQGIDDLRVPSSSESNEEWEDTEDTNEVDGQIAAQEVSVWDDVQRSASRN